ncbi:MAG: TonB-dependent receptor domain-containing protein [Acidobacteriaceae bacterium]
MKTNLFAPFHNTLNIRRPQVSSRLFAKLIRFSVAHALAILGLFWMLAPGVSSAQNVNATLQGIATDSTGAVIVGAKVTALNTSTGVTTSTVTNKDGRFALPDLSPGGPYTISAAASGFKTDERTGITLAINQTSSINFHLTVGSSSQTVEVHGDLKQLQTTTSSMGQVITNRTVVDLPLNQRNIYSLLYLEPGVTGSVGFQYNSFNLSVDGGRPGSTLVLIDGIPASTPTIVPITSLGAFPSVDAVQEFKVMLTSYPAQFGRTGSGIVDVILKSGTNQFHGSAYEFARDSVMDANTYFNNRTGTPLPSFTRSQFGTSLTGPVIIPKLYNGKDKTFFLFSYEGLRQGSEYEETDTVPTTLEREGNFSQLLDPAGQPVIIYDPTTTVPNPSGPGYIRSPFPNDIIPQQDINPVAAAVMKYYPLPNQPGTITGANNFYAAATSHMNIDTYDAKVDEHFNDNNQMFVRYSGRRVNQPRVDVFPKADQIAEGNITQIESSNSAAIDYTHTWGPSFITEVPIGYSRTFVGNIPLSVGFNPSTELGMPNYIAQDADVLLFPGFYPSGYYGLGDAGSGSDAVIGLNVYSLGVDNTKIIGSQVIKFGFVNYILQVNTNQSYDPTGEYNFNQQLTQGPDPNVATPNAGNSIATMLLGVGNGAQQKHQADAATTSRYFGAYIQDDWTVTNNLTLNLGLRYDLDIPRTERFNRMETFDPTIPSPLAAEVPGLTGGTVFVGTSGNARRQFTPRYLDFSPRFGVDWKIDANTVAHGAYGIYYNPSYRSAAGQVGGEGFGSSTAYVGSPNGLTPSVYISNPFPNGINFPVGSSLGLLTGIGTSFLNPITGDNIDPYTENWDVSIQRQLGPSIMVEAAYVGSHGVHLTKGASTDWNADQLTTATLTLGTQLQQSVPNPFYGIITNGPESQPTIPLSYLKAPFPQFPQVTYSYLTGGYEDYNSFQLKMEKRFSSGLTALLSYTGQKQIDDWSGIQNVGNITGGIQNVYNGLGERAVSSNNISREFVGNFVYSLPIGRGRRFGSTWNRGLDAAFGNWQINGIVYEQNGYPLSINTQNTSDSGSEVLRPNLTGTSPVLHGPIISRLKEYFNTAAFSQPAPFTFGDTPRTLSNVRAPGYHDVDFSLFKTLPITRRVNAEFRFEAFNLLNQVQFGYPNTFLSSEQFGVINSQANSPRQIQLAVKVLW